MRFPLVPALVFGVASLLPCHANTFIIQYAGVLTDGTVHGIDQNQNPFSIDLTAGTTVSGTMSFNLDLSPAAIVSSAPPFTTSTFASTDPAITWIGGTFNFQMPALPNGALPIPSNFSLNRVLPPPNGAYLAQPTANQSIAFAYNAGLANIIATGQFADDWTIPGLLNSQHNEFVGLLINSFASYVPFDSNVPLSFSASNVNGGSTFSFVGRTQNLVNPVPPLFGLSENYTIFGHFETTSASGQLILSPEPGTWMAGIAIALLVAFRQIRSAGAFRSI